MDLKDKVTIVTGAGQGIGESIAKEMFKEGAKIVVSDLNQENAEKVALEIDPSGKNAIAIKCDVSNKEEVDALINKTLEHFGGLNILVNNAGIFPYKSFLEMEESDWDKVLDINLKSVFLTSKASAKVMSEGSKIVSVSSIASLVGFEKLTHYCASKGGVNSFVRALALELAKKKINVNAVAPGAIRTPGAFDDNEDSQNQILTTIPANRIGNPEDIANAVIFLASDKSDYITGQVLVVDGGYTLK
ncbi:MAG TPA: SDR family NAD(P)-dependent oxidoreductase [Candidatus Paceibacterota bacterium]|nr:SDR family NAD(P)-dependent oxidoreductase [Candidatus Paceibacterota bacterium]HQB57115.1 SDR family NAD(P)-dependent oxidoreductase [Candidatus Paceibacterota bacterium]